MGKDITMHIIDGVDVIASDIFSGRNSEWFENITGNRWGRFEYKHFPAVCGIPEEVPEFIAKLYNREGPWEDFCYFDFHYIKVKDFIEWFDKYKPNLYAGWVSKWQKWMSENKGYEMDQNDLKSDLFADDVPENYVFTEIIDDHDCSAWLYNYIFDNKIDKIENSTVVYYFDN
jgi:hypothetical protein